MLVDNLMYCECVCSNCSRKKLFANLVDPTGVPSKRNPSVSLMPVHECPDFSMEYVLIEYSTYAVRHSLCWRSEQGVVINLCAYHHPPHPRLYHPPQLPQQEHAFLTSHEDISGWGDVGSVTSMDNMFYGAAAFNQNISQWNVGSVTTMQRMFLFASLFNQNLCGPL